jgi:hypothetical protein
LYKADGDDDDSDSEDTTATMVMKTKKATTTTRRKRTAIGETNLTLRDRQQLARESNNNRTRQGEERVDVARGTPDVTFTHTLFIVAHNTTTTNQPQAPPIFSHQPIITDL